MKKVYVAGPYTKGDVAVNVREAIWAAHNLMEMGFAPYVPHLNHFWHMMYPREYKDWCDLDLVFLPFCDAVIRLPGVSAGADVECDVARKLGIPVYTNIQELSKSTQPKPSDQIENEDLLLLHQLAEVQANVMSACPVYPAMLGALLEAFERTRGLRYVPAAELGKIGSYA